MARTRKTYPKFIVSVAPIKEEIQNVKKELLRIELTDKVKAKKVKDELTVLKKVWDKLGNLTF